MASRDKIIKYVWLIIGILQIYQCLEMYWMYSSGMLFLFIEPTYIAIKHLLFGIISFVIGLQFERKKEVGLWLLLLISILIPTTKLGICTYELMKFKESYYATWISLDYFLFIPIYYSYKQFKIRMPFYKVVFKKAKLLSLVSIIAIGLLILLSEILPYSVFEFLH